MDLLLEMLVRVLGSDLVEPHGAVSGEPGDCYGKYDNNSTTILLETDYSSIDTQGLGPQELQLGGKREL